jgi:hypothetical protein
VEYSRYAKGILVRMRGKHKICYGILNNEDDPVRLKTRAVYIEELGHYEVLHIKVHVQDR